MGIGRPETLLEGVDDETRGRIVEAMRSANRERPTAIYRRFGLEQRGVKYNSFVKWCRTQRRQWAAKVDGGDARILGPSAEAIQPKAFDLLQRLLSAQQERIDAGDLKILPSIAINIRALIACMQLTLEERAEARAAELHKIKIDQLSKDLQKDVETKSEGGTKTLTRDDVYDLIDKAMRGQL